jgi:hypothetical protein
LRQAGVASVKPGSVDMARRSACSALAWSPAALYASADRASKAAFSGRLAISDSSRAIACGGALARSWETSPFFFYSRAMPRSWAAAMIWPPVTPQRVGPSLLDSSLIVRKPQFIGIHTP